MKFTLDIACDNAAFHEGEEPDFDGTDGGTVEGHEIARILRDVAKSLDGEAWSDGDGCPIRVANGNRVGQWTMEGPARTNPDE